MFNLDGLIHEERSKLLSELPKGAKNICSVGCAGSWYFDWIEENYGSVEKHYGVELYLEKPRDLPKNVVWLKNSAGNFPEVSTNSCDLLISGQNLEHLYLDDMVGFFHEIGRVLKNNAIVCIDSPNRLVTQHVQYRHPQHTLELSIDDAKTMLAAAGFEIMDVYGIWRCFDGERFYPTITEPMGNLEFRRRSARENPHESFIWWMTARKARQANTDLSDVVRGVVAKTFQPFVANRFTLLAGKVIAMEGSETIIQVDRNLDGVVFYGPFIPMPPGDFLITFAVKFLDPSGSVTIDAVGKGESILAREHFDANDIGEWQHASLPLSLEQYTEGVETRLFAHGINALVKMGSQILRA